MIKNSTVLKYIGYIKVHKEDDFILKYVNFLILDHCIFLCEDIKDVEEKESTLLYLKDCIKKQIALLQKDTNEIKDIFLQKEDFNFLDQNIFELFEYKFNALKEIKENYLIAYLNTFSD
jgi:hypothetical protein